MKALLEANSVKWSGSWLHALPLPYAGLTMTALEYRTALRFRIGHEVLSSTGRCRFCTTGHFDTFGFHELSCPGQGRLISRHNALQDCLYSLGQQAGLSVQREPQNLLQDGSGDKPANVLFGSFYHGRDLCFDVTIVNPFTDIHKKIRGPDSFLQSAVTHKRQHYAARCSAAGVWHYHTNLRPNKLVGSSY
jgi:YD repeat-containing protein